MARRGPEPIYVNLDGLSDAMEQELDLLEGVSDALPAAMAQFAEAGLRELARDRLRGRKQYLYLEGIGDVILLGDAALIRLDYTAHGIEKGHGVIDLSEVMLGERASNRKQRKDGGWYNIVPFAHKSPTLNSQKRAATKGTVMSYGVFRQADALSNSVRKGGVTRYGDSLPAGLQRKSKSHHKTDIRAGMYRIVTPGGVGGGSKVDFTTFRTISDANDVGWKVPAVAGAHLVDELPARLHANVSKFISRILK